jgi:hypothetical protein
MYLAALNREMAMTDAEFGYQAVLDMESDTVTSLIAYEVQMRGPLQAVLWSVPRKAWIYNPSVAATFLFDPNYQERIRPLDRAKAEQVAREVLQSELPKEQTILEMFEEGERMGWEFGPPHE